MRSYFKLVSVVLGGLLAGGGLMYILTVSGVHSIHYRLYTVFVISAGIVAFQLYRRRRLAR